MTTALAPSPLISEMTPRALNLHVVRATRQSAGGTSPRVIRRDLVDGGFSELAAQRAVERIDAQVRANRAACDRLRRKALAMALLRVVMGVLMMVVGFASGRFVSVVVSAVLLASGFSQLADATKPVAPGPGPHVATVKTH